MDALRKRKRARTVTQSIIQSNFAVLLVLDIANRDIPVPRELRTRRPSDFGTFYAHMRPVEFQCTFRISRALFDSILDTIRPDIEWR